MSWLITILIILLATILVAIIYDLKIKRKLTKKSFIETWRNPLFTTLLGTLLSLQLGFFLFFVQDYVSSSQDRVQMKKSIIEELINAKDTLNAPGEIFVEVGTDKYQLTIT